MVVVSACVIVRLVLQIFQQTSDDMFGISAIKRVVRPDSLADISWVMTLPSRISPESFLTTVDSKIPGIEVMAQKDTTTRIHTQTHTQSINVA